MNKIDFDEMFNELDKIKDKIEGTEYSALSRELGNIEKKLKIVEKKTLSDRQKTLQLQQKIKNSSIVSNNPFSYIEGSTVLTQQQMKSRLNKLNKEKIILKEKLRKKGSSSSSSSSEKEPRKSTIPSGKPSKPSRPTKKPPSKRSNLMAD